jgi:hypothetical protein
LNNSFLCLDDPPILLTDLSSWVSQADSPKCTLHALTDSSIVGGAPKSFPEPFIKSSIVRLVSQCILGGVAPWHFTCPKNPNSPHIWRFWSPHSHWGFCLPDFLYFGMWSKCMHTSLVS